MKKILISLCALCASVAVNAQGTVTESKDGEVKYGIFDRKKQRQEVDQDAVNKILFGEQKAKEMKAEREGKNTKKIIDEKYLAGACPEVNGKVQWDAMIEVPGMSASDIYERLLLFSKSFIKGPEHTQYSNVSVADEQGKQIGLRVQEWLVFERKPLSLDRTKFNYQLVITCENGKCHLSMRNMSYVYEEERGGGQMPAEDMLLDSEALNKTKDGFKKGGHKKFRTKTIDRKDLVFSMIAAVLKQ